MRSLPTNALERPLPTLVTRQGKLFMVFGTPGGDSQEQWTLQFFLNYVEFGMNLQEALDMPTVHSVHFPSSRYAYPEHLVVESHIAPAVLAELQRCGHKVTVTEAWAHGKVMGIHYEIWPAGVTIDRAAPKGIIGYAIG